jgi:hypothetical protein
VSFAESHAAWKPNILRPSGCGKVAYANERDARKSAKTQLRAAGHPKKLKPYLCARCANGTWHLTSRGSR